MLDLNLNVESDKTDKDEDIITLRDVHKILWMCRDFEINHLWQRSIFLAAFMTLLFTGYGVLFSKFCDYFAATQSSANTLFVLSVASLVLSLLGVVFAVFWIMMAKGSKAWYEIYEKAICEIEGATDKAKTSEGNEADRYTNEKVNQLRNEKLLHGLLLERAECNDNIFSTDAGSYSVSRVNIAIGHVSLIFWSILYFVHIGIYVFKTWDKSPYACNLYPIFFALIGVITFGVVVWLLHSKKLKSTSLN